MILFSDKFKHMPFIFEIWVSKDMASFAPGSGIYLYSDIRRVYFSDGWRSITLPRFDL